MISYYSGTIMMKPYTYNSRGNIENTQQKYRLETGSYRLLGKGVEVVAGAGLKHVYWIQTLALCFWCGSKHLFCMNVASPINESTQETNKSRIRPMMNQRTRRN